MRISVGVIPFCACASWEPRLSSTAAPEAPHNFSILFITSSFGI